MTLEDLENSKYRHLPDEETKCSDAFNYILAIVMIDVNACPFINPVNAEEVPDYYTIIDQSMCLTIMKEKVDKNVYLNPREFVEDFNLIVKNCKTYNGPTSVFTKKVLLLRNLFFTTVEKVKRNFEFKNQIFL